jgi:nucleoside-diphosphate-sugar epimerase
MIVGEFLGQHKIQILVTGANGFVGVPLCHALHKCGFIVRAAVRIPTAIVENAELVIVGSIDDETSWAEAVRDVDVIVHLAARVHVMNEHVADPLEAFRKTNVSATEHLARTAAACGVKRLVYVSSIKVNGELTQIGQQFTEEDAPFPQDPYGISKWEAEQVLYRVAAETGLEIVVVRPPLIYGPNAKGNFEQMLKVLARGIPLPLSRVRNVRSLIYVDNLVDGLIACAIHPAAAGQTYLISDGDDVSTPNLLRQLGFAMNRSVHLLPCPLIMLRLGGRLLGMSAQIERLIGSLSINSTKIRHELNWVPPYSLQQGLKMTVNKLIE